MVQWFAPRFEPTFTEEFAPRMCGYQGGFVLLAPRPSTLRSAHRATLVRVGLYEREAPSRPGGQPWRSAARQVVSGFAGTDGAIPPVRCSRPRRDARSG